MSLDPIYRSFNHDKLTFSFYYAFAENYILPISHDEVVYGKCSMIEKMPGEGDMKFASYRAFLAYMMAHPGKKLLFMGQEFAQYNEWNCQSRLDWELVETNPYNKRIQDFVKSLNKFYLNTSPLWQNDDSWTGFQWISNDDYKQSVIAFRRIDDEGNEIIAVCNFVPVQREDYRIGVPKKGTYRVVFNTDAEEFGGTGASAKSYKSEKIPMHGFKESISMTLAPLSVMYLKTTTRKKADAKEEKVISETEKKKKSTARKKTTAKK